MRQAFIAVFFFFGTAAACLLVPTCSEPAWAGRGSAVEGAAPDPADSVIIESKTVAPGLVGGPCQSAVLKVRVWITNKDTLTEIRLPLETRTVSNATYALLSRPSDCGPRTFESVYNVLLPAGKLPSRTAVFPGYNGISPDNFRAALRADSSIEISKLPPNSTRVPLFDIKFDSVLSNLGQFQIDSFFVPFGNDIKYINSQGGSSKVNFVKSNIDVAGSHIADSLILESKIIAPVSGPCASAGLRVKVWITNRDSLANITLPFLFDTQSGGAYATLSRSASCIRTTVPHSFDFLYPPGLGGVQRLHSRVANYASSGGQHYDSSPRDSALFAFTLSNPADNQEIMPPNLTRALLGEIKFDSVNSNFGQFLIDSSRVLSNSLVFVNLDGNGLKVNFVKSIITVTDFPPPCQSLACPGTLPVLYGRQLLFDFNCEESASWSLVSSPESIDSVTGLYTFAGTCELGNIPVTVRATGSNGAFTDCSFGVNVVDGAPTSAPSRDTIRVSHGEFITNQIIASDPNSGDSLLYSTMLGTGFIDSTGLWSLSPGCNDVAASPQTVHVLVTDYFQSCKPGPLADTSEFVLVVTNATPALTNCPSEIVRVDTGQAFSYQLFSFDSDPADSNLNFSVVSAPTGVSISTSGLVQWTPISSQVGLQTATFRVIDGCGASADCQATFAVSVQKGDLNADGMLTAADVTLLLNCAFLGQLSPMGASACDLNCDGISTSVDVVLELYAVFLDNPFPC